jgi:hypothetical protein
MKPVRASFYGKPTAVFATSSSLAQDAAARVSAVIAIRQRTAEHSARDSRHVPIRKQCRSHLTAATSLAMRRVRFDRRPPAPT